MSEPELNLNDGDGCEWNPSTGDFSYDTDSHYQLHPAMMMVGGGAIRLCEYCVDLPKFKRYKIRTPIVRRKS